MTEQNQTQTEKEEVKKLAENIQEIVDRLESMLTDQEREELKKRMERLRSIARDIRILTSNRFDSVTDFDNFILQVVWDSGVVVYSPESKVAIATINRLCLDEKTIWVCLKEKFNNKIPMLNELVEAFSRALESYMKTLIDTLFPRYNDDP
jgi:hypothetical protein